MRRETEARLAVLKNEYEKGKNQLAYLEQQIKSVRETMLRIMGAIMVLEELLSSPSSATETDQEQIPDSASMKSTASAA